MNPATTGSTSHAGPALFGSARAAPIAQLLLAACVLLEVVSFTGAGPAPHEALAAQRTNLFLATAFLSAFLFHAASRPAPRELGLAALVGMAIQLAPITRSASAHAYAFVPLAIATGLGQGSLLVLSAAWALRRGVERARTASALLTAALLPLFLVATPSALWLTIALHPFALDAPAYHVDAALGGQAAFALGRLLRAAPALRVACLGVYGAMPLAAALLLWRQRTTPRRHPTELLDAFVLAGVVGMVVYHACPVAGPAFAFPNDFPSTAPALVPLVSAPVNVAPRNGVPSLHTTWALLLVWHSRGDATWVRALTWAWLGFTILGTLGLGEHYVVDLVVAVPFAAAIDAAAARHPTPGGDRPRRIVALAGAALTALWVAIVHAAGRPFTRVPGLLPVAMAATVVAGWLLHTRFRRTPIVDAPEAPASTLPVPRSLIAIALTSGFAALVYEVVFGKSLALTFGSTARAGTTVLATYMGGMALGSVLGGRLAANAQRALRVYAMSEVGIASLCALSPLTFAAVRTAYVSLAAGTSPGSSYQLALQVCLGAVAMLPATILMGVTTPALAADLVKDGQGVGRSLALVYAANTFGAALGALAAGYVILPALGIRMTTWVAVLLNLVAALIALRVVGQPSAAPMDRQTVPAVEPTSRLSAPPPASPPQARFASVDRKLALLVLAAGGFVTLALEVTYTHILAIVVGNSTYAFSLMLFSFLIGLGGGAALMQRHLRHAAARLRDLAVVELALAAVILVEVFAWDSLPAYFATFAGFPTSVTFGQRELVRFAVSALLMTPPAILIGSAYPLAIEISCAGHPIGDVRAIGRAGALNTVGNILGAVAASFVLLPSLGSLRSLHVLAGVAAALGLASMGSPRGRDAWVGAELAIIALLALAQPRAFDLSRLASGSNVYFLPPEPGVVIDHAESADGGLTAVVASRDAAGHEVHTLLTNGKFQGDDSPDRQMRAQYGFSLVPLLHCTRRESALSIGFGVGGTARALRDAGFERVEVAELSADVLALADTHFRSVNAGVLADPRVVTHVTDGRNLLALTKARYSLITVEVSSIWFAGAASLYGRDFYRLAKARLAPGGVLQQWVQLHHMRREDLVSILASLAAELPQAWVYLTGGQGMIVACEESCPPTDAGVAALDAAAGLTDVLRLFGGSAGSLRGGLVADPATVERLLATWDREVEPLEDVISTDDNLRLEYGTPRGNTTPNTAAGNLAFLRSFRAAGPSP